jgi:hypothetical protein
MTEPGSRGFMHYVRAAFLLPGNVMTFLGCVMGSLALPDPPAFIALLVAAEAVFLGGLASSSKFQLAVDAREHTPEDPAATAAADWRTLLDGLPNDAATRFARLRARCHEMRRLANAVQREGDPTASVAGSLRTSGLDTLLWGFLRLLRHHAALQHLLMGLDRADLDARVRSAQDELARAQAAGDERLARSHQERLATTQARLDYHDRTARDAGFLRAELDRVEEKILALSEMAVNQHDPNVLSAEIDAAASSMQATESSLSTLSLGAPLPTPGPVPAILDDGGPLAPGRTAPSARTPQR